MAVLGILDPEGRQHLNLAMDSETGAFVWKDLPQDTVRFLLYFPEENAFAVSETVKAYAGVSRYTVDLENLELDPQEPAPLKVRRSYDFRLLALCFALFFPGLILLDWLGALLSGFWGPAMRLILRRDCVVRLLGAAALCYGVYRTDVISFLIFIGEIFILSAVVLGLNYSLPPFGPDTLPLPPKRRGAAFRGIFLTLVVYVFAITWLLPGMEWGLSWMPFR